MEQEFYRGLDHRVRNLAEKADPFTRRGLLDLANRYDTKGDGSSRSSPTAPSTAGAAHDGAIIGPLDQARPEVRQTRPEELVVAQTADPL
ncbi:MULTISPECIES: hypothetical protein [unclassified Bradyrhizobium]|uniref:hypothetical protein n=1 Tax=unclassified Bradyrhizobium TaxID=2631580 RepID=UPI001FF99B26|nr:MULTISPECIES: hypothetical protein [unclassified Bradyrhizobium]